MKNNNIDEMPNVEDSTTIVRPPIGYKLNGQVTLYQTSVWKTYIDKETNEQLIINLLDVKYLQCYENRIAENYKYWKYVVYVKVDKAETIEIETTESIYRQIERDLEMGE